MSTVDTTNLEVTNIKAKDGTAAMSIADSTGNVGIGTSSPVSALGFGEAVSATGITFQSTSTIFNSGKTAVIKSAIVGSGNGSLVFETYEGGSGGGERMRISSSGNLLVGTTSDLGGQISSLGNGRDGVVAQVTNNSNSPYLGKNSSGSLIYILSGLGTIYAVNTTVQSVSDVRTKENIKDAEDGLDVVMRIQPRRFDFKPGFGGDRKNVLGFIAQEIESVFPDAVDTMPAGSMPDEPEDPYKSVGPGALIPVLVKAIQEQQAIISALTARVAALEN